MFAALSSLFHSISLTDWDNFMETLPEGNPYRWAEYSISASVMSVSIAIMIGVREMGTLMIIFAAHHILMWGGLAIEQMATPRLCEDADHAHKGRICVVDIRKFKTTRYSWLFELGVWLGYLVLAGAQWMVLMGATPLSRIPMVAWATLAGMFLMFNVFGLWQIASRRTKGIDVYTYESGYCYLSMIAKVQLFSFVLWGAFLNHDWLEANVTTTSIAC